MPIKVEIVSPEKVLFSRAVDMALIPGLEAISPPCPTMRR